MRTHEEMPTSSSDIPGKAPSAVIKRMVPGRPSDLNLVLHIRLSYAHNLGEAWDWHHGVSNFLVDVTTRVAEINEHYSII
jgi:hypothetical protein